MRGTMTKYKGVVCRGSWALGTACGKCDRCKDSMPVSKKLDLNQEALKWVNDQYDFARRHGVKTVPIYDALIQAINIKVKVDSSKIPDLESTLRNVAEPCYDKEHGEYKLWTGGEEHAKALIDSTKLLHDIRGYNDTTT